MRVASWNLSCYRTANKYDLGDFDGREEFDYFIKVIKNNNFDVLCLQENFANESETYSTKICKELGFNYYFDSVGNTSFCNKRYGETVSIISKYKIEDKKEIKNINPNWETTLPNGAFAKSFDKWFQLATINGHRIVNGHFIPEKTFKMDYSKNKGNEYFNENLSLLNEQKIDIFCCDFNTISLDRMTKKFCKEKGLINAIKNIETRPISKDVAVINDAILIKNEIKLLDRGMIMTKNDHYLIWIETE